MKWSVKTFLVFGCVVQTSLYLDRAIIAGAYSEFTEFISTNTNSTAPGFQLGLLQSAFIAGLSLSGPPLAWLCQGAPDKLGTGAVHTGRLSEKLVITIGLGAWAVASWAAWFAGVRATYYGLLFARALSGVGEAAVINVVPAILLRCLPERHTGKAMGLFLATVPVGTAMGFAVGARFAQMWHMIYLAEAGIGALFIVVAMLADWSSLDGNKDRDTHHSDTQHMMSAQHADAAQYRDAQHMSAQHADAAQYRDAQHMSAQHADAAQYSDAQHISAQLPSVQPAWQRLIADVWAVVDDGVFLWLTLANAGYAGVLIAMSTFGTAFLMDLNLVVQPTAAANLMSTVALSAGVLGIACGGVLLDKAAPPIDRTIHPAGRPLVLQTSPIFFWVSAAVPFSVLSSVLFSATAIAYTPLSFSLLMFLGLTCCFTTQAAIYVSIMTNAPPGLTSLANSMTCLLMHIIGDVPSPMIVGYLRDKWAPHCHGNAGHGSGPSSGCLEEEFGLRVILVGLGFGLALFHTAGLCGARTVQALRMRKHNRSVLVAEERARLTL